MDAHCCYAGVLLNHRLVSAILMPEVRDRDLSLLNDAVDCAPQIKRWATDNIFKQHTFRTE